MGRSWLSGEGIPSWHHPLLRPHWLSGGLQFSQFPSVQWPGLIQSWRPQPSIPAPSQTFGDVSKCLAALLCFSSPGILKSFPEPGSQKGTDSHPRWGRGPPGQGACPLSLGSLSQHHTVREHFLSVTLHFKILNKPLNLELFVYIFFTPTQLYVPLSWILFPQKPVSY